MIKPVVRQVLDSNRLPVIRDLSARTVDDPCDFIGNHKFKVLDEMRRGITYAASSSPMKSPSLILIAPIISGSSYYYLLVGLVFLKETRSA